MVRQIDLPMLQVWSNSPKQLLYPQRPPLLRSGCERSRSCQEAPLLFQSLGFVRRRALPLRFMWFVSFAGWMGRWSTCSCRSCSLFRLVEAQRLDDVGELAGLSLIGRNGHGLVGCEVWSTVNRISRSTSTRRRWRTTGWPFPTQVTPHTSRHVRQERRRGVCT